MASHQVKQVLFSVNDRLCVLFPLCLFRRSMIQFLLESHKCSPLHSEARSEVKRRLEGAVEASMIDLGSLARQINRGSKSSDIVIGSAKAFASLESNVENTGAIMRSREDAIVST